MPKRRRRVRGAGEEREDVARRRRVDREREPVRRRSREVERRAGRTGGRRRVGRPCRAKAARPRRRRRPRRTRKSKPRADLESAKDRLDRPGRIGEVREKRRGLPRREARAARYGPCATATTRAPSERPHATSCLESPTTTHSLPVKERPVTGRARVSATGPSSSRHEPSSPQTPNVKRCQMPAEESLIRAPRSTFPVRSARTSPGTFSSASRRARTPGLRTGGAPVSTVSSRSR